MSDYDTAIDLDPQNFLAHYNRGLLRMQLGDDNRAITDFDFVIRMEPDNVLAIFNRAILLDKTGNLRAAIRDYTRMIEQFPNFWTGLSRRANCYRRLGLTAKAELDEFRILKAQMNKRIGVQPRWSNAKKRQMRRRSEIDPDKYNQMVVADSNTPEREYKSDYRGRVQDRAANLTALPMFALSSMAQRGDVRNYNAFSQEVEAFNRNGKGHGVTIFVNCAPHQLSADATRKTFASIDSLTTAINNGRAGSEATALLTRAVLESVAQNYDDAIADLTACLSVDSASVLALWQRAYCKMMKGVFDASASLQSSSPKNSLTVGAGGAHLTFMSVVADLTDAIKLDRDNQYLYYNRGCAYLYNKDYTLAIDDFTRAIAIDQRLAEAFYNRGLARISAGNRQEGIADLSKAGELGLYGAYSVIKKVSADGGKTK